MPAKRLKKIGVLSIDVTIMLLKNGEMNDAVPMILSKHYTHALNTITI